MRYLVLSDIHSNIEALQACLQKARSVGFDKVLSCGDLVGYGPNPKEVLDLLDLLDPVVVRGNHDRVISGIGEPTHFNGPARQAAEWTRQHLPAEYRARLANLPQGPLEVADNAQLVHGSIRDEDEYLVTQLDAVVNLSLSTKLISFFGHTHEPGVMTRTIRWVPNYEEDGSTRVHVPADRMMVNPGSVGQPRDGDNRASFLIWDNTASIFEFYRVAYPFNITQARMREVGLPDYLINRLSFGR